MKISGFERKIVAAISAVAIVPLVGALVLGQGALREVYQLGVNPRVRRALEDALGEYREQIVAQRRVGEVAIDSIADDHVVREAVAQEDWKRLEARFSRMLARHPTVGRLELVDGQGEILAGQAEGERLDPARMRTLRRERLLDDGDLRLRGTLATELARFQRYQDAGRLVEVYSRLEAGSGFVSSYYILVYIALLVSVIGVALAVGIIVSRRVTRRVAVLAAATRRVGRGDLAVEVPADATDEIGDLTRAFNQMVRDLRESRQRIDYLQRIGAWQQFARRLAHEIKNPLTPIQLAVQEVHNSYRGDDARYRRNLEDALTIVTEEVATLRRLVGEFSTFAKLPQARLSPANLNDFVRESLRGLHGLVAAPPQGQPPVEIVMATSSDPLPVEIDAMMLRRCLDNLVRNALQALSSRDPATSGRIAIRTGKHGDKALLEVEDDGPGVDPEDLDRVFDPYFTTKHDGTGLGLAIVKKVILEHGGEIGCDAGPWGGARFRVWLPLDGTTAR